MTAIAIHGGAGTISRREMSAAVEARYRAALERALDAGRSVLANNGTSLDAVCAAVVVMEDSPLFNAGRGACYNSDEKHELDASVMEGATLRAGAVAAVSRIRNPVLAARAVMEQSRHVLLVARGAERFARKHGVRMAPASYFHTGMRLAAVRKKLKGHHGTVGAVALDAHGNLAAATSTGGTLNKAPGRLGDSSLIGCGCYADNLSAAVSTTGWGEPIMKLVLAKWTADRISAGNLPEWAAQEAMNYLKQRLNGHGGIIVLNAQGQVGIAHNTPRMAWALKTVQKEDAGIERGQ